MHGRIIVLSPGARMFRRSYRPETSTALKRRGGFVWFALEPNYGANSYGPVLDTWTVRKPIRLLNIGSVQIRQAISSLFGIPFAHLTCDEQYSGGGPNARFHKALAPILRSLGVHGTFISDTTSDLDCKGPTEVVLSATQLHRLSRRTRSAHGG